MKRQLLTLIIFCFCSTLSAQNKLDYFKAWPQNFADDTPEWAVKMYAENPNVFEVEELYQEYYRENPFVKNLHTQNYKYWKKKISDWVTDKGYIKAPTLAEQQAFEKKLVEQKQALKSQGLPVNWESIGPYETYDNGTLTPISWQVNVYSMDVAANNHNKLIAGTEGGGVFLSTDKGLNWQLVSKNEVFANGITAVKINPTSNSTFLVSANDRIYRTTNDGTNWTEVESGIGSIYEFKHDPVNTNKIFAVGSTGLYRSIDGGVNWAQVYSDTCWDLEFHPTDNNTIYLLKSNSTLVKTEFFKSINGGATWDIVNNGWYSPEVQSEAIENGGKIAVSANDPNRVYAALVGTSKDGDSGWIGIYRSNDSGDNWTLPSGQIGGPYQGVNTMPWNAAAYSDGYHQGYYNFDFVASPNNADLLWMGTIRLTESTDGGATYESIGAANSNRLSLIHADIQDIEVVGNEVWVASDGGINYSNDNLQTHESRKNGIIGSEFWGFGAGWNEDVLVGGKYHNGNSAYYQTYTSGIYHHVGGVEEWTGYVNPLHNKRTYFNQYWSGATISKLVADNLGGSTTTQPSVSLIPNEPGAGLYFDKRYADHIYASDESIFYKSTDGGSSFEALHDFGQNGYVTEIEISYSNPDVIYVTFKPNGGYWDWYEIHKSTDGGQTWNVLPNIPANRWRIFLSVNPADENELWVTTRSGANGEKVFQTTDGGATWINRSASMLDGISARDVLYQGGTDIIYIAATTGVFYYNKSTDTWTDYSTGLPTIANSFKLQPFYKENKLRLATYGRGIWEIDLATTSSNVIAQAITSTDLVACSRDVIQFDSYSIVDQSNVTWNWNITPTPDYIESTTMRNPQVILGADGEYDVSLTVTTPNGSDTYTQAKMVTVNSQCEPETVPGNSVELTADGDWVQTPSLNLTGVTEMTMTAWIKTDGIQPDYAGIVMNDGDAAGLNFREGNNTLGYHWPGGAWWWDSNLIVPDGEWTHVAITVGLTRIVVYVNGVPSQHNTAPSPVDVSTLKIGSYKGWGSRNIKGEIDEVVIWDRELSEEEIRTHRHLTKENLIANGDDIVAYYQFNSSLPNVLDRVNSNHATLASGATKVISSAPLGGGTSFKQTVNSAANYTFGTTGLNLDFTGNTTLPNNDVYVSRINLLPHLSPNDVEGTACYWIINNYGDANADAPTVAAFNSPYSNPTNIAVDNPTLLNLQARPENEFANNWVDACGTPTATLGTNGEYIFNGNCYGALAAQYFIIRQDCPTVLNMASPFSSTTKDIIADQEINAENEINTGSDILYQAGNCVKLNPGFELDNTSQFKVTMDGCP